MKTFRIRVKRKGDQNGDYSYYSFYDVEAHNYIRAEMEARLKFCEDFGTPYEDTEAYTFNKLSYEL